MKIGQNKYLYDEMLCRKIMSGELDPEYAGMIRSTVLRHNVIAKFGLNAKKLDRRSD